MVLIKGQGKVVNVRSSKNRCLIEATLRGFEPGEPSFYGYRKDFAIARVFGWITNIHENKRYYYTFDNLLLFTENIQDTTQIFPHQIIASGLLRARTGFTGMAEYMYPVAPVCIAFDYSPTLAQKELPVRLQS